jgi:hypothetical protein
VSLLVELEAVFGLFSFFVLEYWVNWGWLCCCTKPCEGVCWPAVRIPPVLDILLMILMPIFWGGVSKASCYCSLCIEEFLTILSCAVLILEWF